MGFAVLSDGSPTEQGVDHRQVQKELGQVSVYLQKPVVLSPSSAKISWTVSRKQLLVEPHFTSHVVYFQAPKCIYIFNLYKCPMHLFFYVFMGHNSLYDL